MKPLLLTLITLLCCGSAGAEIPFTDENCVRAAIGEASNQGYKGLLYVCCAIRNRGTLRGVHGFKAKHVDRQPFWVWQMARKAWAESKDNRIHAADHWENIKAFGKPSWAKNMIFVCKYKDHTFYRRKR